MGWGRMLLPGNFGQQLGLGDLETAITEMQDVVLENAGRQRPPQAGGSRDNSAANMIADILLSGPRLVSGAWTLGRESRKLTKLDVEGCSQLLTFLASRPLAVPYAELREAGWEDWLPQLRSIDGVVFLEKGLNLTAELRKELVGLESG